MIKNQKNHLPAVLRVCRYWLLASLFIAGTAAAAEPPVCLYVSSYHPGYHWNDGIESGLSRSLGEACKLQRFYMDTKRHKGPAFAEKKAAEANQLIRQSRPDVVIACDDNASKYLVVPYLAGTATPVVFCGVNWSVEAYGYPYPNVTGMIEVAPIPDLLTAARRIKPHATRLGFVSADVPTQHKEVERLSRFAAEQGLQFDAWLAGSVAVWKAAFERAQQAADVVVLGNPAGIDDWDREPARDYIQSHTRVLTVSFGVAMSRHAVIAMVNQPEEQGAWSGQLARLILADLPITPNRRWRIIANPALARRIGIRLPESILQGAEILEIDQP